LPKTVLVVDGVPDSVSGRTDITGEAFGVFDQVNIIAFGRGVQEAKVGIPVVTPR